MAETPEQRLERVARALCEARGVEPDAMVPFNNGTLAYTTRPAWRCAAKELQAAKLLFDHVAMLADGVNVVPKPCGRCDAPPGAAHSSSCPDGVKVVPTEPDPELLGELFKIAMHGDRGSQKGMVARIRDALMRHATGVRAVDTTKPHWRCVCSAVAMPLTDDTPCNCPDTYAQQWTRIAGVRGLDGAQASGGSDA